MLSFTPGTLPSLLLSTYYIHIILYFKIKYDEYDRLLKPFIDFEDNPCPKDY